MVGTETNLRRIGRGVTFQQDLTLTAALVDDDELKSLQRHDAGAGGWRWSTYSPMYGVCRADCFSQGYVGPGSNSTDKDEIRICLGVVF